MKNFLLKLFTWWNSQTFGTQFWTWMYGEPVGDDEFGNRYYRTCGGKIDKTLGFERRRVIYNGYTEASADTAARDGLAAPHGSIRRRRRKNYKPHFWHNRTGPT